MSLENCIIEDRLHEAGYRTERDGGVVKVFDPVHTIVDGKAVVTHHRPVEIRSIGAVWKFIEARS